MVPANPQIYLKAVLPQIPRILSLQDRNPFSKTYGCFDRGFWLHKTSDFPSSVRQIGVEVLALVWANPLEDNPYYQDPKVLEWCLAGIRYWIELQHQDGSFDEWYPNEHGWAGPTGYLVNAMAESYFLLKDVFPSDLKGPFVRAVTKAGHYLLDHDEEFVLANHHAIALLPIYQAYVISQDKSLAQGFEKKFSTFEHYCYIEGWCLEYDGPDIGYLSGTISFLARLYRYWPDARIAKIVERAVEFSSYFLYPDGFFGGTIGSRETGHFYHFGYEFWSSHVPLAERMAEEGLKSLSEQKLVSPLTQEDHYVLYRLAEYLKAYLAYRPRSAQLPSLPFEQGDFEKFFQRARIVVRKVHDLYCVVNLGRGGVLKAFSCRERKLLMNDSGWIAQLADGKVVTSQWSDPSYRVTWATDHSSVEGRGHFVVMKAFTPLTMILFRVFLFLLGWQTQLAYYIKAGIRKLLMVGARHSPVSFKRTILVHKDHLSVTDEISLAPGTNVRKLYIGDEVPVRYVPQSRYFQMFELHAKGVDVSPEQVKELNSDRKISIQRDINF